MDSIASPKVKTIEREEVVARFQVCNTLGVKGRVGVSVWDYED